MTRRLDGSYTCAISGRAVLELTPQGIRFGRQFMPQFIQRLKAVQMSIGKSFVTGPESLGATLTNDNTVFEKTRVLDPEPLARQVQQIVANVRGTFPELADVQIEQAWGAYVDCTPDSVPVISALDRLGGVFLAAGCSGHGFGVGPGIGHLITEMVAGDTPSIDPTPFRLSRLLDGSKVEVGPI
ncbi:NAD(P)/FAD-dependent oxidoreductase [Novosphingobium colocasiae]